MLTHTNRYSENVNKLRKSKMKIWQKYLFYFLIESKQNIP